MRLPAFLPSRVRKSWIFVLALAVMVAALAVAIVQTDAVDVTGPGDTVVPSNTATSGRAVTLVEVVDGDTIRVRMPDGGEERVRYIGIDAPEIAHEDSAGEYLGDEATSHNAALLASGPLRLETDKQQWDDFGRLLAYVWAGEVFVNERMVLDGYAWAHDYPPNIAMQEQLWDAHDRARASGIGVWGEDGR